MNSVTAIGVFLIVITIAILLVLLGYAVLRRTRLKTGVGWLAAALLLAALATASYLLPPFQVAGVGLPQVTVMLHALALVVFSALFAKDLMERQANRFLVAGLGWVSALLVASLIWQPVYGTEGWITVALASWAVPGLLLIGGVLVISAILIITAFRVFYVTPLPEVANRALFWVLNVTLMLTGFVLAASGTEVLVTLGVGVMTLSYVGALYSQVSYRVFDIRNVLGLVVRLVVLVTTTGLALFASLYVLDRLALENQAERTLLAGTLALVAAALYVPIREVSNLVIDELIVGRKPNPVDAMKRYSQEVSRALEIEELVDLASRALNQALRVKRSGMLLVSNTGEDAVEMTVIRAGALANVEQRRVRLATDGPIYRQIAHRQEPLSQFDIEFDPAYASASEEERAFLRSLEMSAYAPIIMDNALIGLLAAGAKINDSPIHQYDLALLVSLANQSGVALRNTRLVADLRHLNKSMQALNQNLGTANDRMGKLDSVKTDFVTIASHELRTPLAQVRGYTDIIDALNDQGMLDQDQTRGLVSNLRKASERMEELISAMLDVSQLDVNSMDLRFAQTSPESVLRMAIEPLTDPIKQRKLTLSARGLRGLPPIEADMQRLVQAFRNIITNAIKFTPDGGRIDIRASQPEGKNGVATSYVLIEISDTGIGVSQSDRNLIFNKFYRASDPGLHSTGTYKFMGAGPGLGLTIAKGVIEGHGGRIWVESPGYNLETLPGSTFFVQLPLIPPENARRVLPFEQQEETRGKLRDVTSIDKLKTTEMRAVDPS